MRYGSMEFSMWERVKILFGAKVYTAIAFNRPARMKVGFKPPDWIGPKIGSTWRVPE